MALIKQFNIDSHTQIYFWYTIEPLRELQKGIQLPDDCKERFEKMKVAQMRCNFLAVRQVLKSIGYSAEDLYYNSNGKPFLKGNKEISISHSNDCVVVIISNGRVGIDIEKKGEKVLRVVHKYTNWELNNTSMSGKKTILKLVKIWAAKEALYKAHNKSGINFKDQINIRNFFPMDKKTSGRIMEKEDITYYNIGFIEFEDEFEDYIISYCTLK